MFSIFSIARVCLTLCWTCSFSDSLYELSKHKNVEVSSTLQMNLKCTRSLRMDMVLSLFLVGH